MHVAPDEQTGLVTRSQIAERVGVTRPAVSNWARRHKDFPTPVRSGDTELFHEREVAGWLRDRTVPSAQLLGGEEPGTTYADRFVRRSGGRARDAAAPATSPSAQDPGAKDREAVDELMGKLADRVRGPAPLADYMNLCFTVMYARQVERERWRRVEYAMAAGHGTRDVPRLLGALGGLAQEALRRTGVSTDMRGSLLQLEPRSWDDLVRAVRTAAKTGTGAYQLLWEAFSARDGRQNTEFCSPVGLASLAAELLMTPGRRSTVLDPYTRGGEMLAAAHRQIGEGYATMYGETLDGRLQAVASLYLLHHGVRPRLTSTRSDRWPQSGGHRVDFVLTNPPFNMSDTAGAGRRTGDWPYGPPPRGNDNFAWVQHVLKALVPGGRAVMVMPVKAGNSVNTAEIKIRRALIDRGVVECVITLPPHLFSSTPVPVSLWILRRVERPVRKDILFVDAQELGEKSGLLRVLGEQDRAAMTAVVRPWLDGGEYPDAEEPGTRAAERGFSAAVVARTDITGKECSLRPADYVRAGESGAVPAADRLRAAAVAVSVATDCLGTLERQVRTAVDGYRESSGADGRREATLAELCEIQAGPSYTRLPVAARTADAGVPLVFPRDLVGGRITARPESRVPWETAEKFEKFTLLPNDIVCVRTGAQQQPALTSMTQAGWLLSSNVTRVRVHPDAGIDPVYLHAYLGLRHVREWMAHRAAATAAPSLSSVTLGHLPVRFPSLAEQLRCVDLLGELGRSVDGYRSYIAALEGLRTELAEHLLHGSAEPL